MWCVRSTRREIARKRYILFIPFINQEMTVSEPSIRKPTKKAFHFPKHANGHEAVSHQQADAPDTVAADVQTAPTKAKKQKRVAPVEAASASVAFDS